MPDFDYDVMLMQLIRRRILNASEISDAHVHLSVRCASQFLLASNLLGTESRALKPYWNSTLSAWKFQRSTLITM